MPIGLNQDDVETLVHEGLVAGGRYTLAAPGGRPIFTKEQRDAIARALSDVVSRNNDAIINQLRQAGVAGI